MTTPRNAIDWFEIPVRNMDRAAAFYEALLGTTIRREAIGPNALGVFTYDVDQGVGGCLLAGDNVPVNPAAEPGPSRGCPLLRRGYRRAARSRTGGARAARWVSSTCSIIAARAGPIPTADVGHQLLTSGG